ncbi:sulfite exporter TauE/SafE family protein [bacterium]|nr:sulfite exporter TauE/SafE family protein [bacterium]
MTGSLLALAGTALTIGVTHTVLGPDHYLPFVALSASRGWSRTRTLVITALCGVGHVLGSVVLGALGLLAGVVLGKLEAFEAVRGDLAATLLLAFGVAYMLWGLWRYWRPAGHQHALLHRAGIAHAHPHTHEHGEAAPADGAEAASGRNSTTVWVLFIIFVLGPCEPLIPLLMYPASEKNVAGVLLVVAVFGVATISTMLAVVYALTRGLHLVHLSALERLSHFLAGAAIALCGAAILFLGL